MLNMRKDNKLAIVAIFIGLISVVLMILFFLLPYEIKTMTNSEIDAGFAVAGLLLVGSIVMLIFAFTKLGSWLMNWRESHKFQSPFRSPIIKTGGLVKPIDEKPESSADWLEEELSSDLNRVQEGIRGRYTKFDFSNIYNREPFFEIFIELNNTTLFTFSLKGVSGLMNVEGQPCVNPPQVLPRYSIKRNEPVTIRLPQSISPETAKLIQNCANKKQEMSFDLKNIQFEFDNETKGYEQHKPRLSGGDYKIIPKDGLKVDDAESETKKGDDFLTSFEGLIESFRSSEVVWGWWVGGVIVRINKLLEGKCKGRILLFNPYSVEISKVEERVDFEVGETKADIWYLSRYALKNSWQVKWYPEYQDYTLTIFDATPIQDERGEKIPKSDNAFIIFQPNSAGVRPSQRDRIVIRNKGTSKEKFEVYFRDFGRRWNNDKTKQVTMEDDKLIVSGEVAEPFTVE
jgi:hypothetical protein